MLVFSLLRILVLQIIIFFQKLSYSGTQIFFSIKKNQGKYKFLYVLGRVTINLYHGLFDMSDIKTVHPKGVCEHHLYSHYFLTPFIKLDRVGPVSNRPFTNKLHPFVKKKLLHVTYDM